MKNTYDIAVLPGDGIGVDVTNEAVKVLRSAAALGKFSLNMAEYPCGAVCYQETGTDLPTKTLAACRTADAVLLGAMGHPSIRKPDGTELIPQVTLRVIFDLYAGVRPCRLFAGAKTPLKNADPGAVDFVILREQSEGLFASQPGGIVLRDEVAADTLLLTRKGSERIIRYAFDLAKKRGRATSGRSPKVTAVDKANIFKSFAFFRKIALEIAATSPEVAFEATYIDAQALYLVQRPEHYDVVVTENMFGDILSDLGAGLIGGMGMAPSGDIGDRHAVFQPAHGTAPDIAGKGIANPIAAILSAAMMLDWLASRHSDIRLANAARSIESAVEAGLAEGKVVPVDQGGNANTRSVGDGIAASLARRA